MKQVSIFGAAIVDILVSNADARVFRTGSSPTGGIRMSYGGDALNEATVLHKLGVPVRLQTVLGRDDAGEAVLRRLEALGLDTQGVRIREDLRTSINVVLITPDGERSFLTDPHASMRQLRPEDLVIPEGTDILCLASIFVFPLLKTAELRDFQINYSHEAKLGDVLALLGRREEKAYEVEALCGDERCFTCRCEFR